jgi:hypothetical protein
MGGDFSRYRRNALALLSLSACPELGGIDVRPCDREKPPMEGGPDALFFRMLAQFRAITALRDGDHGKYIFFLHRAVRSILALIASSTLMLAAFISVFTSEYRNTLVLAVDTSALKEILPPGIAVFLAFVLIFLSAKTGAQFLDYWRKLDNYTRYEEDIRAKWDIPKPPEGSK